MQEHYQDRIPLEGSQRPGVTEAKPRGPVDPNAIIEISIYLRRPDMDSDALQPHLGKAREAASSQASAQDFEPIKLFAQAYQLSIVREVPEAYQIVLSGRTQDIQQAFSIPTLHTYETKDGPRRLRSGPIYIPRAWEGHVIAVLGIDDRAQSHFHSQRRKKHKKLLSTQNSYTPATVASLYKFPSQANGQGQCVALIELGGGYQESDLQSAFQSLPSQPQVVAVSVDNATNQPGGDPSGADGEVELDIEVVGSCASAARIAVYFAPNTDQGFVDAVNQAVHDQTNKPNVISISWGSSEDSWTGQARTALNQAFYAAGQQGITVCCAAGDQGASDGVNDNTVHVDFPASSPYVLACGGTSLHADAQQKAISSEVVWNDGPGSATGGGVSAQFPMPTWQASVNPTSVATQKTGRGVPDIAGNADPQTGYQVMVDGNATVIGGTSAVAPLWAALIACLNQELKSSVGFINPVLYQQYAQFSQAAAFHDITQGTNDTGTSGGGYQAQPGWDACTGLGTPNGEALLQVLQQIAAKAPTNA